MKQNIKKCEIIDIITPQRIILNGLLFGPNKTSTGFIYVPGLSSNVFSKLDLMGLLSGVNFLVLSLNTRGHVKVVKIQKLDKLIKESYHSVIAGKVHEVFTNCKDDLTGVVKYMLNRKIKNIYLVGHSIGCQNQFII